MSLPKKERYLKEILSYIKFPYDKYDIKTELEAHIVDKIEYYLEQGLDIETAETQSIKDMGHAKEIGKELNKQHNPLIGWIWVISKVLLAITIVLTTFIVGFNVLTLFNKNPINEFPKSKIVYKIDLDEKVKIDDRVIYFKNVIYDKNGDMNIFYTDFDTRLLGMVWSWDLSINEITDNLGNNYHSASGYSTGGIITKHSTSVKSFSKEADTLIINYNRYNRTFKVEIPLKVGELN